MNRRSYTYRTSVRLGDWVAAWPRWAWYVAMVPWVALLAWVGAGFYALLNGGFWTVYWWALGVGLPLCWLRFAGYDRQRAKGRTP